MKYKFLHYQELHRLQKKVNRYVSNGLWSLSRGPEPISKRTTSQPFDQQEDRLSWLAVLECDTPDALCENCNGSGDIKREQYVSPEECSRCEGSGVDPEFSSQ